MSERPEFVSVIESRGDVALVWVGMCPRELTKKVYVREPHAFQKHKWDSRVFDGAIVPIIEGFIKGARTGHSEITPAEARKLVHAQFKKEQPK